MYVCICNAVTDNDVHECLAAGAGSFKEVKSAVGMKPGCGLCTKRICAMVSQRRTAEELADALTGGPLPLAVAADPGTLQGTSIPEEGTPATVTAA